MIYDLTRSDDTQVNRELWNYLHCAGALPVADGNGRNSRRIHHQGGVRRKRRIDCDGSSRTRQNP